jgi:hypothetical protein
MVLLGVSACSSGQKVVIYNDLPFDASIFFCGHGATVLEDPHIVEHGHSATIRVRGNCPLSGPASKEGLGFALGDYLGCLEIPVVEDTDPPRLRMSEANPNITEEDCG